MQSAPSQHIPDGLLAANALLNEKPHQGVPSWNLAPHLGISEANCTAAIGLRASLLLNRVESRSTGKERDAESGLDYFGARYYGSPMGRMMSPDWSAKAEPVPYSKLDDPQTLNLYAYVGNNPLDRTDPTGHCVESSVTLGSGAPQVQLTCPTYGFAAAPTLPNGQPKPPANPPSGGGNWKWFPDPRRWNAGKQRWEGNKRGGTWGPEEWDTKKGPRPQASWDDNPGKNGKEHWDIKDGTGKSWKEDEDGKPMTDKEAHGRPFTDTVLSAAKYIFDAYWNALPTIPSPRASDFTPQPGFTPVVPPLPPVYYTIP